MIRTQDEIRAERPPLVLTDGPETGLNARVSDETASGVDGEGLGDSSGSTGRTGGAA